MQHFHTHVDARAGRDRSGFRLFVLERKPGRSFRRKTNLPRSGGQLPQAHSLNIGVPMPFVNTDKDTRGRTRYVDAQANFAYGFAVVEDLPAGVQGLSHHPHESLRAVVGTAYGIPYRADLLQYNIGVSSLRTWTRAIFRRAIAVFNQDAWQ
ncbi:MAG: hypothetical protein IPL64_08440 [Flavobacteriales bacterium]|nr:hypothetical protein [Flavobacteriales bacterium]